MRVRKKPVEVEAELITKENLAEIAEWCDGFAVQEPIDNEGPHINIYTLEGTMRAEIGDWIIKGVKGEFYPCKPAVFEKTYDIITGERVGDNQILVEGIVEHEDGSATIMLELSDEMLRTFAMIAVKKAIIDSVEKFVEEEKR